MGVVDYPSKVLQDIIHLPGLRGNPERAYPLTATGPEFPGTFEKYTASVVAQWSNHSPGLLDQLGKDLESLGLTWKGIGATLGTSAARLEEPLWGAELDAAICKRITPDLVLAAQPGTK